MQLDALEASNVSPSIGAVKSAELADKVSQ